MSEKSFIKELSNALYLLEKNNPAKAYTIYWNSTINSSNQVLVDVEFQEELSTFKISVEEITKHE